jgi:hypothetical protein
MQLTPGMRLGQVKQVSTMMEWNEHAELTAVHMFHSVAYVI